MAETIERSGKWGPVGSFLYQTGMSMGDFLLNSAITGGFSGGGTISEGLSLAIMGTGAAADATIEAKDRGLTDDQAFALGTIAGAAEVFTEKFSIEALLEGKWEDGAIKYILKNVFTEGAEEVGSDFINLFADILIAKDKSEWRQAIDAYMAEGKTEGEAFGLAAAQQAAEMGLDFLGGALSGGTMATAGVGIGTARQSAEYQRTGRTLRKMGSEMVNSIIETAETLDQNSEAYKLGQELKAKLEKGKKLTDAEIGRLFAETGGVLEGTEQTAGQAETAQEPKENAGGIVLPTAEEASGIMLPTAEQSEAQERPNTDVQRRQDTQQWENDVPGMLPTAEQTERRQQAARAKTETERTGILAGVDEDTIAKVRRIGDIVGREVVFFSEGADEAGGIHNGYYSPADGRIYINARSQSPAAQIISHELTHSIEASGSYSDLRKLVLRRIEQTGGDLRAMRQAKGELYARHGETLTDNAAIDAEIVAEYVEKYLLTDEQSIRAVVRQNRTLGQRILQFIDKLLAKLGSSSAQERAFLAQARNYYQSALQETQSSFTTDMQQRAAAQAQNLETLQQQMANGEISDEDAEAAFNDMYDPELDMQQGLGEMQHSYAGANANGANLQTLREAQEMEQAGADMESIRKATGWHKGMDGKWRFEIDDSKMEYNRRGDNHLNERYPGYKRYRELLEKANSEALGLTTGGMTSEEREEFEKLKNIWGTTVKNGETEGWQLEDYLYHDELFRNYPQLRKTRLEFRNLDRGTKGRYNRETDTITVSNELRNAPESTLVHEIQHVIQRYEGFSGGASPEYWARREYESGDLVSERLQHEYDRTLNGLPRTEQNKYIRYTELDRELERLFLSDENSEDGKRYAKLEAEQDALYEELYPNQWFRDLLDLGRRMTDTQGEYRRMYQNTAGEIEARDASARRTLTAEQRRETSPAYGSEDTVFADGGESYSIDPYFSENIREWYDEGQSSGERFTLGSTGDVLQGLGAIESDIYMNGDKISRILRDHPEMTINEIGKIPELLDDPVLILKSKGRGANKANSRVVLYGTMKAQNGEPVMAVLDLRPSENGFVLDDMQKVNSAYTKKNPANFVAGSDVLYVDKKRTAPLLRRFGLTIASRELLRDGSIGSISYEDGTVKLDGVPFSDIMGDTSAQTEEDSVPQAQLKTYAEVEAEREKANAQDIRYSVTEDEAQAAELPTAEEEEKKDSIRTTLPKKAQDYLKRAERSLVGRVGRALGVPRFAQREYLQEIAQRISEEYLATGRVSEETTAELFERAYSEGIVADDEFYRQYKDIKDQLRTQAVTISEEEKQDIANFDNFRKSAAGNLRIVNEGGTPVEVAYEEMRSMAPELFPYNLTQPADQLMRMFEVARGIEKAEKSLKEYYGPDAEEFKRWAKNDFDSAIGDTIGDLRTVKRYADERTAKAAKAEGVPVTTEQAEEAYKQLKKARWESEKAKAKNLLTDHDNVQLGRLLKGEIELKHLNPKTDNVKGITAVYEATMEYERLVKLLTEYKKSQRAKLRETADQFLETANDWKDKRAGILYSRETMERNILDIVKDKKLAQSIIAEYFTPVHEAQAQSTRLKNKMRERVQGLNLSTKETRAMQKAGQISEAHAVQLLGEAMDNIRVLENSRGRMAERDGKTLSDWRGIVREMWEQNPQLDKAKIEHAVEEFRRIYDELFQKMNEVRVRNGYEPVNYRSGYFPHFQPGDGDGIMGLFGKALGIDTQVTALPTTINGLTHAFRPGIQWFGNAQQRLGFETAYDAVEGFDRYIEGVADVIYQTDNIQKLRALATQARYRTGDEGLKKQADAVYADTRLTEEEKRSKIDSIYEGGRFALSNFVVELEEYTNLLANKKSRADRNMEQALGRNMYNLVKGLESRVAANMVAINPASWLTNFIPLTQGGAMLDRGELLRGMWQTLRSFKESDGIVDASAFLTNRKGSDPLVRTWVQKASATMSSPMEYIDQFTAGSLVRARYNQNLKRGMSEAAAMTEADNWTAGVMADRSKGSTPTLFNRNNPLTKVFTQFQLEVNNQLSYLFKDMPRAYKEKGLAALAAALFKFFLGAWLFDEVYEYFIGRRPALDPIGILNDTVGDITGYELPNLVELGVGAVTGDMPSFQTEKQNAYDTVTGVLGDAAEELPFIGGVLGGGRVPISSALPDWDNLLKTVTSDTWSTKKKLATAGRELMNPLTYLALPFGGGQLKKIYQGLSATIRGGSYSVDAEGNDLLQYPVYNDNAWQAALNAGQAMLFGKTSLKTGREWAENGFGSMGAKETAAYQGMTEAGVPQEDAYNLLQELRGTKKTETESKAEAERRVLQAADISGDGKSVVYYGLMATDKERELMDALADSEADMGAVTQVLLDVKNAGSLKGAAASNTKRTALAESPLTDSEKREMYRYLFGEKQDDGSYATSRDDDIMAFQQAGLDFDAFLNVQNEYTTINEKYSKASEKTVEFSRWVNRQNLTAEQADTVRSCFKYYSQIPAEAARYDSFIAAGLDDDAAYELTNSLNALKPEEGKETVSSVQKWRAALDAAGKNGDRRAALKSVMTDNERARYEIADSFGVEPEAWVRLKEILPKYDADGNGSYKNAEVEAAIDGMTGSGALLAPWDVEAGNHDLYLTKDEKAVLWQLYTGSKSASGNPYSVSTGWKVLEAKGTGK